MFEDIYDRGNGGARPSTSATGTAPGGDDDYYDDDDDDDDKT